MVNMRTIGITGFFLEMALGGRETARNAPTFGKVQAGHAVETGFGEDGVTSIPFEQKFKQTERNSGGN